MLDLSLPKILVLGVLALIIFGPDQLPKIAAQAGRALRDLRMLADKARNDLRDNLGPEFRDFDVADLNPRAFVRKHLLDDTDGDQATTITANGAAANGAAANGEGGFVGPAMTAQATTILQAGERPPYDAEAT